MSSFLSISVRFLDSTFHGRRDGGEPEWPPSPLRLFQALLAAASRRWHGTEFSDRAAPALRWLEAQPPPIIVAPPAQSGTPYRLSVPNNAMDIVARAWVRGNTNGEGDADPRTHRTMKTVRLSRLTNGDTVHYVWELSVAASNEVLAYVETLCIAARGLAVLGWGVDLVAGNGRVVAEGEATALQGERWSSLNDASAGTLRVPKPGTFDALVDRHQAFLNRLPPNGGFNPVPALTAFSTMGYRRASDPPIRQFAVFALLKPDASSFRAFNPVRDLRRVVGMMRDVTRRAARLAGWTEGEVNSFVLGHGESKGGTQHMPVGSKRFAYLPLPSIENRGQGRSRVVGAVRRISLTTFSDGCANEMIWARRALSGMELIDEHEEKEMAILSLVPSSDNILRNYVDHRGASTWATVTPVVLPGYDDHDMAKTEFLIRKAIVQAGFSDVLARHADLDWRKVGFWPGTELATRYNVPAYLRNFPRYHVRIAWRDCTGVPIVIRGPICLGGGRFCGLGLFAAIDE